MTKPTEWPVRPAKTLISLGILPVWSVFAVRMKKSRVINYPLRTQQSLIRLGRCPGWSESLHTPFCWFRHAAHYSEFTAVWSNNNKIKSSNKVSGIVHSNGLNIEASSFEGRFLSDILMILTEDRKFKEIDKFWGNGHKFSHCYIVRTNMSQGIWNPWK